MAVQLTVTTNTQTVNLTVQKYTASGVQSLTGDGVGGTATDPVLSFPTPAEIGLGNVDNTSDLNKPISTLTLAALDLKTNKGGYEGTAQDLKTLLDAIAGGSQGAIAIVDTPTSIGYYYPTESGTYTNAGGLVVDLTAGLTVLIFDGTNWGMQVVPVDVTIKLWEAQSYLLGQQVYYENNIYEAVQNLTSDKIPGEVDGRYWKKIIREYPRNYVEIINPIDLSKIQLGFRINYLTGLVVADATKYVSNFIPIDLVTRYIILSGPQTVNLYDADYVLISFGIKYNFIDTADPNIKYFKINGLISDIGSVMPAVEKKYALNSAGLVSLGWVENQNNELKELLEKNIVEESIGLNLYDYNTIDSVLGISDFIPVNENKYYRKNQYSTINYYDNTQTLISSSQGSGVINILTPANTAFLKINLVAASVLFTDYYLNEGYANIPKLQNKSYKLSANITEIISKKWSHLGDSISTKWGTVTVPYPDMVNEKLEFAAFMNFAVTGRTMLDYQEDDAWWKMFSDTDIVTLAFGTNEHGYNFAIGAYGDSTSSTFYGVMKLMVDKIRAINPSCSIAFFTPIRRYTGLNVPGYSVGDYRNAIYDFATIRGLPVLDLYNVSGLDWDDVEQRAVCWQDQTHPTQLGLEKFIYPRVLQFMKSL